jgi:hypothetical protein
MPVDDCLRQLIEEAVRRVIRAEVPAILEARVATPTADLLTIRQAAAHAAVSVNTLRRWITTCGLPTVGRDRTVRVRSADLDRFLREDRPRAALDPEQHAADILKRRRR